MATVLLAASLETGDDIDCFEMALESLKGFPFLASTCGRFQHPRQTVHSTKPLGLFEHYELLLPGVKSNYVCLMTKHDVLDQASLRSVRPRGSVMRYRDHVIVSTKRLSAFIKRLSPFHRTNYFCGWLLGQGSALMKPLFQRRERTESPFDTLDRLMFSGKVSEARAFAEGKVELKWHFEMLLKELGVSGTSSPL